MKNESLPATLAKQQSDAAHARWAGVGKAERIAFAKRLWKARLAKHQQAQRVPQSAIGPGRMLPR